MRSCPIPKVGGGQFNLSLAITIIKFWDGGLTPKAYSAHAQDHFVGVASLNFNLLVWKNLLYKSCAFPLSSSVIIMESFATPWYLLLAGLIYAARLELASYQMKTLYFSFITAHSDQYTALGAVPAVNLALEHINSDPRLLPGYNLSYANHVGNSSVKLSLKLAR